MKAKARQLLEEAERDRPPPIISERDALARGWNPDLVGERLVQAFSTLDRMPPIRGPRAPGNHWPGTLTEWADRVAFAGMDPIEKKIREESANRAVIKPTSEEITHMEIAFDWLKQLHIEDTGVALVTTLWALQSSRGLSMKQLCARKHWAPRTFLRKRLKGLARLAEWLNGRGVQVF